MRTLSSWWLRAMAESFKWQGLPINEFFAAYCLEHWRIESPQVKLINIHSDLLKQQSALSLNHRLHFWISSILYILWI